MSKRLRESKRMRRNGLEKERYDNDEVKGRSSFPKVKDSVILYCLTNQEIQITPPANLAVQRTKEPRSAKII